MINQRRRLAEELATGLSLALLMEEVECGWEEGIDVFADLVEYRPDMWLVALVQNE